MWSFLCLFSLYITLGSSQLLPLTCQTESSPNPIAAQYPNLTTGTINGTVAILPIPYAQARSAIPGQYPILTKQYQSWLKDTPFPAGMYPAMLQYELDHDVQSSGIGIPDFLRASISFPFVDRLNDGYTSMAYGDNILISATNALAIAGTAAYGYTVTPGSFEPPCDAYAYSDAECASTYSHATSALSRSAGISLEFTPAKKGFMPYSLDFYKNITNQPQFSNNALVCDNYIRLFNSSVTGDLDKLGTVQGEVTATKPFFLETTTFKNVYGIQVDNAFIENNYKSCQSLQGYHGAGSGD
ncbi:MAG: hypothetical protein Q9162_003107 [Coniocarpon cinnabarinum]